MEIVAPLIGFNWTLVMVLVTFFVLYLIVKKLFFEKIHTFMEAREQKVRDQFDNAEAANSLAEKNLAEYKAKLDDIEIERRGVLKEARMTAENRTQQIIKEETNARQRSSERPRRTPKENARR